MEMSEKFYHTLINNMYSGYAYHKLMIDSNGNPIDYEVIDTNDAYCRLLGHKKGDIVGKRLTEIFPCITKGTFDWLQFFSNIALNCTKDSTMQYFDSIDKWIKIDAFSDKHGYFVGILTDITEIKEKELTKVYEEIAVSKKNYKEQNVLLRRCNNYIKEKEEIYQLISEASNDGIWYWNMKEKKRNIAYDWYKKLGIPIDPFCDMNIWYNIVHPDDRKMAKEIFDNCINGVTKNYECTYRIYTIDGGYKWLISRGKTLANDQGNPYLMVGVHIDITSNKLKEDRIKYLAYFDTLTGLPNRANLMNKVTECIEALNDIALIVMDIDDFKSVNDSVGFSVGDIILKQVSNRLKVVIDETDFIARLSGDEFAVILKDVNNNEEILERAKQIKNCFNEPFSVDHNTHQLSVSLGIAVSPYDGIDSKELIKNADTAMYRVKNESKNGISFFTQEMRDEFLQRINVEKQLKNALQNKEFKVYYQPQFDIKTGKIRGFEALLRWVNEELGFVSPIDFIPIAEEIGIINEIGEWVLMEACSQYKQWNLNNSFRGIISVNISPIQLKTNNFYDVVSGVLKETGIEPSCLELEITENLFIEALEPARILLNKLVNLGVKISLDDFGTGYSSLSYLKTLPINTLKIDKSFIENTTYTGVEREITRSVIELVRKIGLETIAEGVENDKQLNFLYESFCDNIQGFLTGRPMSAKEVVNIIKKGKVDLSKYIND